MEYLNPFHTDFYLYLKTSQYSAAIATENAEALKLVGTFWQSGLNWWLLSKTFPMFCLTAIFMRSFPDFHKAFTPQVKLVHIYFVPDITPITGQCFYFILHENTRQPKIFWCFQGLLNENIGQKWINLFFQNVEKWPNIL